MFKQVVFSETEWRCRACCGESRQGGKRRAVATLPHLRPTDSISRQQPRTRSGRFTSLPRSINMYRDELDSYFNSKYHLTISKQLQEDWTLTHLTLSRSFKEFSNHNANTATNKAMNRAVNSTTTSECTLKKYF